jgi:hypothetical protein
VVGGSNGATVVGSQNNATFSIATQTRKTCEDCGVSFRAMA